MASHIIQHILYKTAMALDREVSHYTINDPFVLVNEESGPPNAETHRTIDTETLNDCFLRVCKQGEGELKC